MKTCSHCKKRKPIAEFYLCGYRRKDNSSKPRSECKKCSNEVHRQYVEKNRRRIAEQRRRAYFKDKTKAIKNNLKRYYGINLEKYNQMFKEQKGRCKICGDHQSGIERRFDVDHNHKTGKVRGLLCIRCNRGIGLLKDSRRILLKAAAYLQQA